MKHSLLTLVGQMADVSRRRETARALARELGAEDLLLFSQDPDTAVLLPAPGLVQTLPDGRTWRAFLNRCLQEPYVTADLPFPDLDSRALAAGVAGEGGTVLVLLGGSPARDAAEELRLLLPLLGATLRGERVGFAVEGEAAVAREVASQAKKLTVSLDNARRDMQRAFGAAEEARLWLSTTLHSIGDAVIATDASGRVTFANEIAQRLTGWLQADAVGRPLDDVFVIINEETRQPVESPVSKVLRENCVVGLANHTLLVARDGTERPIDDSGAPIRNSAREIVGVVLVFRDFTERRRAEQALSQHQAEIEALNQRLQRAMTETHHRVKNNLQVIAALVDMQIGTGAEIVPVTELERLSQHIRALATVHDLLTLQHRENRATEDIPVRAALEKLLPLLQGITGGRRLDYHIEDADIPITQVTSLTVLVNELISNATKHGKGEIGISFSVTEDQGTLEVSDDGPGFPPGFDPHTWAHTGVELIESVGRWDLRGEIFYINRPGGGACVRVRFPLPTQGGPAMI